MVNQKNNFFVLTAKISTFLVAIATIFVINGFVPVINNDIKCYEEIAKTECKDKKVHIDIKFRELTFQCCTLPNNESRRWVDSVIDCDRYIFLKEDHRKCSNKYYWFGLKKVD